MGCGFSHHNAQSLAQGNLATNVNVTKNIDAIAVSVPNLPTNVAKVEQHTSGMDVSHGTQWTRRRLYFADHPVPEYADMLLGLWREAMENDWCEQPSFAGALCRTTSSKRRAITSCQAAVCFVDSDSEDVVRTALSSFIHSPALNGPACGWT
jgi:hypothetical protein